MESRPVELILAHNLSEHLASPVLLLDAKGTLIFFNEPAEPILGLSYEDVGELPVDEWTSRMDGDLAFMRSVDAHRTACHDVVLTLADGTSRTFQAVTLPLTGREGRHLGAIVILGEGV
jgi:PAS domain-containing protein